MPRRRKPPRRRSRRPGDILVPASVVLGTLVLAALLGTRRYVVPSSAMEPTLRCSKPAAGCTGGSSDHLLVPRFLFDTIGRGDVIVFRTPSLAQAQCGSGGTFVKRVVALPGERFEERKGTIFVDGRPLREPYVRPRRRDDQSFPPRRVPADAYFVLGDNRAQSCDSRVWGPVPKSNVIGRVVAVYWPPSRIGFR